MIKSVLAAIFLALAATGAAQAQEQIVLPCYQNPSAGGQGCIPVSAANPLPVTGGGGGGGGAVTLPLTPSIANGSGVVPTQGGAVLSATNGEFTNILQGNAVLSATNGIFGNLLQGNAALSSGNPIFVQITAGAASIGTVAATQSGTWNVTNISGTVSLPTGASTSANQSTEITSLGTIAGAVTSAVMQDNIKQVNGVTTLAGAGAVGTGSIRVAVGQDTTTIAGSAPGTAGTPSTNVVTVQGATSMTPVSTSVANTAAAPTVSASGSVTSLILKGSATTATGGVKYFHAENATTTGGYCILYNGTTAPGTGSLTAANVLAFQLLPASGFCDWTATNIPISASTGAVVLVSSGATPFTYTTGTITASIYGLAQ